MILYQLAVVAQARLRVVTCVVGKKLKAHDDFHLKEMSVFQETEIWRQEQVCLERTKMDQHAWPLEEERNDAMRALQCHLQ